MDRRGVLAADSVAACAGDFGQKRTASPMLTAMVLSQMGSCRVEQTDPDLDEARDHFRRAMAADNMQSIPSQEAALHLVTTYLVRPDEKAFREAAALIEELVPRFDESLFEAIIHALQAQVALWLREFTADELLEAHAFAQASGAHETTPADAARILRQVRELRSVPVRGQTSG